MTSSPSPPLPSSKILVDLPYNASTNKYDKFFPHPYLLLKIKQDNDELFDLNLSCRGLPKPKIKKMLLSFIKRLEDEFSGREIIVSCGHFPADADKNEYFDFFIKKAEHIPLSIMGIYSSVNSQAVAAVMSPKHKIIPTDFRCDDITLTQEMISAYPKVGKKLRASMKASYGCPWNCQMCPVPLIYKQKYLFYDIDKTVEKIKAYHKMGVRFITFTDDNLATSVKFIELLKKLKKEKENKNLKGMTYLCQEGFEVRAFHNEEFCQLLKESNFVDIKMAIENIKPEFLKKIGKYFQDFETIDKAVQNIKKYDIPCGVYLLIGYDANESDIIENIRYLIKNNFDVRVNILRPYENNVLGKVALNFTDEQLRRYKALAYSAVWYNSFFGVDLFDNFAVSKALVNNYSITISDDKKEITLVGTVNFGITTSRFLSGLTYIYQKKYNKEYTPKIFEKEKKLVLTEKEN